MNDQNIATPPQRKESDQENASGRPDRSQILASALENKATRWKLENQIPAPIEIARKGGKPPRRVPPFGKTLIDEAELETYLLDQWVSQGIVEVSPEIKSETNTLAIVAGIWVGTFFYSAIVWLIWRIIGPPPSGWWTGTVAAATVFSVVGVGWAMSREGGGLKPILRQLMHSVGGILQLIIAIGVPASVIFVHQRGIVIPSDLLNTDLILPALQTLTIGILSVLPALLFYLFDRQRVATLREEFFRSMVFLIPSIRTVKDAESVFGARADEALGELQGRGATIRLRPHNRAVIFMTTVLVTIGWILALASGTPAGNPPPVETSSSSTALLDLFVPASSPLVYAFLGAYVFGIGMLFRRYTRSDIKPSAYGHFSVRIVSAIVIAWVAQYLLPVESDHAAVLIVSFSIGFFPDTWLEAISEYVRNLNIVKTRIPSLEEKFPLEKLDGINIYHRSRLIDEGIENIENLAHADLVDLTLQTRIPLATLIDWIDQSILYLHTGADARSCDSSVKLLRAYGIRTASDLEAAYEAMNERNKTDGVQQSSTDRAAGLLGVLDEEADAQISRVQIILDALRDDEWMRSIRFWRSQHFETTTLTDPTGWKPQPEPDSFRRATS